MKMWKTFLLIVTILLLLECDPIQAWRRRRKRRRAPPCDKTPCSWAWSTCSNTCGGGMRSAIVTKRQGACGVCEPDLPEHCNDQLCPDVNECSSGAHNCNDAAECTNIAGTFQCKCLEGFTGDGVYCENVNECTEEKKVCPNDARCEDTIGSFTCTCNEGHRGNGTECKDIDECGTNIHNCDVNAICINSPGTFSCTCIHGYKGDGKSCEDVDECVIGIDSCNNNAECTNTDGSFNCTCLKGYSGDGFVCKESSPQQCRPIVDFVETFEQDGCTSQEKINVTMCEGQCTSASVFSIENRSFMKQCSCCSAMETEEKTIDLVCPGGGTLAYTYKVATKCACGASTCGVGLP